MKKLSILKSLSNQFQISRKLQIMPLIQNSNFRVYLIQCMQCMSQIINIKYSLFTIKTRIIIMNLAIRLQNHGKKNHPLWWIVVAPRKRNIKGRFIQHIGYWSPRHGINLQRQVILNMPRVKYWMSCGAVPTFRIHRFLSIWGVLPKPWYYKKSEEELEKQKKPEEQLNDKQKRKMELKRRKKERQMLTPMNFHKTQAKQRHLLKGYLRQLQSMKRALQRENQIIRQLLLYNQFQKTVKINELTGKSTYSDTQQLKELKNSLQKAKSQLYLIQHNYQYSSPIQQSKVMRQINQLCKKIRSIQEKSINVSDLRVFAQQQENGQFITEQMLNAKLQYQLIHKKLQKLQVDLQEYQKQSEPVLLQEYADFLVSKQKFTPEKALIHAQREFIERGRDGIMMTKYDLINYKHYENEMFTDDFSIDNKELNSLQDDPQDRDASVQYFIKRIVQSRQIILPSRRPVHPLPDLSTYIPQEYYEPIENHNTSITIEDPLISYEQMQKYHEKKGKSKKSDKVA